MFQTKMEEYIIDYFNLYKSPLDWGITKNAKHNFNKMFSQLS